MQRLFQLQEQLLSLTPMKIVRQCAAKINWDQQLIAIRGARGVGKSTIIRQYIRNHYAKKDQTALYCSLDANYFVDHSILDLAEQFYRMGGKHLFLDEIHKYLNWGREIKEINDYYPDLKVVISGSSLLELTKGEADLSRRCMDYDIPGLSFREYLQFYEGIDLPTCSLEDFQDLHAFIEQIYKQCKPMAYFDKYLQYGYYPYYKNNPVEYYALINKVIRYVIEEELPRICKVELENTRKIRALMNILAASEPYEVDISKMSVQSALQRPTVLSYLKFLNDAKLLNLLYSDLLNVKKMQKPDKIYIENTNMLYALATHPIKEGTIRETFAVNQLSVGHEVEYGKKKGDFKVDGKYTFEVGGPSKDFKQIAGVPDSYVLADNIDYPYGNKLPLWIIGFLY